jgi:hypothetical protein
MRGGAVNVARRDGWERAVPGAIGQHRKPDGHHTLKGLAPANDLTCGFGFGSEVSDGEESSGSPEIIAVEADGATGLECEESVSSGFGFDGFEEGKAVVPALGIHTDSGVGDGAELGLPLEEGSAEDVSGAVVVFAADFDGASCEGGGDCLKRKKSEGVAKSFSD